MRNPQDTKNVLLVSKYISRHFNLTNESKKLFNYRVKQEPLIAPEYQEIIKNAPDLRARFKIDQKSLIYIDEGWKIFENSFSLFVSDKNIRYKDFVRGKVVVNKNEVKLFKLIVEYYMANSRNAFYFINQLGIFGGVFELIKPLIVKKLNISSDIYISIAYHHYNNSFKVSYQIKNKFNEVNIFADQIFDKEIMKPTIVRTIKNLMDYAGTKAMPKKNLELVISKNPADIFMASTSESWSSCINVDSDYNQCYWHGLPGAIIDKNRAVAYITDGRKKSYRGIVVDRFLSRTFLLTARNRDSNKTGIVVVREYPIHINFKELFKEIIEGVNLLMDEEVSSNSVSRYYFEALYHDIDYYHKKLSYIYLDNSIIKIAKRNKAKFFPNDYCYHKFGGAGYPNFIFTTDNRKVVSCDDDSEVFFNCEDGLSGLIKEGMELSIPGDLMDYIRYA